MSRVGRWALCLHLRFVFTSVPNRSREFYLYGACLVLSFFLIIAFHDLVLVLVLFRRSVAF